MENIYKIQIKIENQEQANEFKQICIDYKLKYWNNNIAFMFDSYFENDNYFRVDEIDTDFGIYGYYKEYKTITKEEFLKQLNNI